MIIIFDENLWQTQEERGFLQVHFTSPACYNDLKKDKLQPSNEKNRLPNSSPYLHHNNWGRRILRVYTVKAQKGSAHPSTFPVWER